MYVYQPLAESVGGAGAGAAGAPHSFPVAGAVVAA